ncbi:hypothetical protein C8R43DRAFT_955513 [Mycena crocata]|nr:hypothetical protein C8R43DRAFT_955513 [Mycena crocata]
MLGEGIRISRWKTKEVHNATKVAGSTYRAWWNEENAPYEPLDPEEFPYGRIFGQYIGAHSRYLEIGTPWFERRTLGAEVISEAFETQLELMGATRNASNKALLAGITRQDELNGTVLKICGVNNAPANLLGRVVMTPVSVEPGDTPETNKLVAHGIVVI